MHVHTQLRVIAIHTW